MKRRLLALATALSLAGLGDPNAWARARRVADVDVPETAEVAGRTLALNGVALYEASFLQIDIFVAALYLEKPSHDAAIAASCDGPTEFDFFWLYDPSRDQIAEPWRETMRANAGADLGRFEARIERLVSHLRAPAEGQRWRFVYSPGVGLTLKIDEAPVVTIPGQDFCRLFMGGHVGERAESDMRKGLLGMP